MVILNISGAMATLTSTTNDNVLPLANIKWNSNAGTMFRHANLTADGLNVQVRVSGYYEVMVKFGAGEQETLMDFGLVVDGIPYKNGVKAGEVLIARLFLAKDQLVGVQNQKAGVTIHPTNALDSSWFALKLI